MTHRKAWIDARPELLAKQFAVSVCGFAIPDNHLHVLCRLDPGIAAGWSDEEVVRRWIAVYRPSCLDVDNQRRFKPGSTISAKTPLAWPATASGSRISAGS